MTTRKTPSDLAKLAIFGAVCREDRDNAALPRNQRRLAMHMAAAAQRGLRLHNVAA